MRASGVGVETEAERYELAKLDGRYLATEVCSGFVGRTVDMYAAHGTAATDWFDYMPTA